MLTKEKINKVLKTSAVNKDFTQSFIAKKIGVSRSTINHYLNNTPSSLIKAIKILKLLDLEIKDFYKNKGE